MLIIRRPRLGTLPNVGPSGEILVSSEEMRMWNMRGTFNPDPPNIITVPRRSPIIQCPEGLDCYDPENTTCKECPE